MNNRIQLIDKPLSTAVLFIVFNRLETAKKVFSAIQLAKPPRLYIASDGARINKSDENNKVESIRKFLLQNIDWECEVKTLFREKNLGAKEAVSSAITWFFKKEEMGIILEDDCLPKQSFFWFCEELLEKYKNHENIAMISGRNDFGEWNTPGDYFFSKFGSIWGWATWAHSWKYYDGEFDVLNKPEALKKIKKFVGKKMFYYRKKMYQLEREKKIDAWDVLWGVALDMKSGLIITPKKNLIKNIGFGADATHTKSGLETINYYDIQFPIKHNQKIVIDELFDKKQEERLNISNIWILKQRMKLFLGIE